jgi:alpha-tubulin suppressor-like RCC1 family protein
MKHRWLSEPNFFFVVLLGGFIACSSDRSPTEVDDGSLEAQIRAVFPAASASRDDALARLSAIRAQLAANANANARSQTFDLIDLTLKAFQAGQLTGGASTTTGNAVSKLVSGLYQLVGMTPPQIPNGSLGGDGTAQVVGPSGGTIVTPAGAAGVVIPPGALPEQVLVTINKLASTPTPGTGPLPTQLKQYPPFYDYSTYPPVPQLGDSARVGICQVTDPSNPLYPPEPHERLRLGHGTGAAVELLDRVDVADFLRCAGVSPDRIAERTGWTRAFGSFRDRVAAMILPGSAYAAHGGLGGKVKSFSPFGAVDPGAPQLNSRLVGSYDAFCALDAANAAFCWGDKLTTGSGVYDVATVTSPQRVSTSLTFGSLTGGAAVICGLTSVGTLYCWGDNENSQYGYGASDVNPSFTPRLAAPGLSMTWVSAGAQHMCGIVFSGATYCWGQSSGGTIGNGDLSSFKTTAVPVATSETFATVSAGFGNSCALTKAGLAYCWGVGTLGQLGNGANTSSATPVPVSGGLTFTKIVAGFSFACGITTNGTYCWGRNRFGELGSDTGSCPFQSLPNALCPSGVPLKVATPQNLVDIALQDRLVCGLTAGGAAYCWGENAFGELGNGTTNTTSNPTPVAVSGGLAFVTIAVGQQAACAATADGTIYCWGRNNFGQVGQGTTTAFYTTPQRVSGVSLK